VVSERVGVEMEVDRNAASLCDILLRTAAPSVNSSTRSDIYHSRPERRSIRYWLLSEKLLIINYARS